MKRSVKYRPVFIEGLKERKEAIAYLKAVHSLVRYLELFNLLIGIKKSNIGSFKELASRLDDGGFRITKDTPNLTIDDVAKNDYIAYISRGGYKKGGWFEYDVGAGIYSFGINKDYDENFKMPEGGYDDWDDYLYSPYTLNCFEGLYFYDYNSDEYKWILRYADGDTN